MDKNKSRTDMLAAGRKREADGLDVRQSNPSCETEVELEGDIRPSVSQLERSVEPFYGPASYVDEQTDVVDEASALAGATMSDGPLVFASDAKSSFPSCEAEVVLEGDNNLLLSELVHGFKSLTTSRMVPRFTRPVTDMVDGLWVSCDRTLMRKPILRLGIIFYWAFLHALLATLAI